MRALYKEKGVKTSSAFLPLLIQMPVLMALFQALSRVEFLKVGHFLWLDLGAIDPTYILPVLAALFTFFSSWLTNKAMPERNGSATTHDVCDACDDLLLCLVLSQRGRTILGDFQCLSSRANLSLEQPLQDYCRA